MAVCARGIEVEVAAGDRFIEDHNAEPKPFIWTADPVVVLGKVNRGIQALASMH